MLELKDGNRTVIEPVIYERSIPGLIESLNNKCIPYSKEGAYLTIENNYPIIDTYLVVWNDSSNKSNQSSSAVDVHEVELKIYRFIFSENGYWKSELEKQFKDLCINNDHLKYDYDALEEIYAIYKEKHPEWHLKRYYTHPMRLLDHIHHCQMKNTAKEILYKSGLDELAEHFDLVDEYNLLATKPAELYDGITMRTLRSLNCRYGAELLSSQKNRQIIVDLQKSFPDTFKRKLNEAQSRYLLDLIEGDLTYGEIGRIFNVRKDDLLLYWNERQYKDFLSKLDNDKYKQEISRIDPIYKNYLKNNSDSSVSFLYNNLVVNRKELDRRVRVSNRRRNFLWQERDKEYIVRYPQTVNDFFREAIYQQNCLLTYWDALINNATTILFIREKDDVNKPFITLEIYEGTLMQAYHRFNEDCTKEEAKWIIDYCKRHNIKRGNFEFNKEIDRLF